MPLSTPATRATSRASDTQSHAARRRLGTNRPALHETHMIEVELVCLTEAVEGSSGADVTSRWSGCAGRRRGSLAASPGVLVAGAGPTQPLPHVAGFLLEGL
jgi:hypothetical protein